MTDTISYANIYKKSMKESVFTEHKIPFELHVYPFGDHGAATCDGQTLDTVGSGISHAKAWLTSLEKWLKLIKFTR